MPSKKLLIRILLVIVLIWFPYWMYKQVTHYFAVLDARAELFAELKPVLLENCELTRFGPSDDGGYIMCRNLLAGSEVGYSFGIEGRDEWGCEMHEMHRMPIHQYDCFDTRAPVCPDGTKLNFNPECISGNSSLKKEKFFTLDQLVEKNADAGKRKLVKMDIEGDEWETFKDASTEVLENIDQMVVEFHEVNNPEFLKTMRRLKEHFYIVNLHYNNNACDQNVEPFPARVFEILLVNKRIGRLVPGGAGVFPNPLDKPNRSDLRDCQT